MEIPARRFLVVSVDGGGIRGIVPAMLLLDLHERGLLDVGKVDLFAGTSTGSLIAVGLAADLEIEHVTRVYRDVHDCREIFTPWRGDDDGGGRKRGCLGLVLSLVEQLVRGRTSGPLGVIDHLLFPKYASSGFRALLRREAPDRTVGDLRRHVFVPSMCLDTEHEGHPSWRPTAFHNMPSAAAERDGFGGHSHAKLVDAVLASSAAPVAFAPHELDGKLFIDGGMVANNPGALALSAAMGAGLVGDSGTPLDRVFMLSLGTGASYTRYPPEKVVFPPPYGVLGWMWPVRRGQPAETPVLPLVSAMESSVAAAADYHVRMMLPDDNYRRVELSLADHDLPMDDCSGLAELEAKTSRFIERSGEWGAVREWVGRHFR